MPPAPPGSCPEIVPADICTMGVVTDIEEAFIVLTDN
jgi:hypothetical protein